MLSFDKLVNDINTQTKVDEYLLSFFSKKNFKEYEISEYADKSQIKAIKIMFESKKNLGERVDDAFSCDPFCREALFVYLMISEDVFLQLRFNAYYEEVSKYGGFDEYQKLCYLTILDLYVDFLLDINNVTKAIEVQRMIVKLTNNFSEKAVSRLAYSYYSIENCDDFYRLYTETKFDLYAYLLLMVTLLIHDEKLKAQEVLLDMFKNEEYGTYLDHVWDLDENDPKQKNFHDTVQDCFDDLKCVPTFFSWVNQIREKYAK